MYNIGCLYSASIRYFLLRLSQLSLLLSLLSFLLSFLRFISLSLSLPRYLYLLLILFHPIFQSVSFLFVLPISLYQIISFTRFFHYRPIKKVNILMHRYRGVIITTWGIGILDIQLQIVVLLTMVKTTILQWHFESE